MSAAIRFAQLLCLVSMAGALAAQGATSRIDAEDNTAGGSAVKGTQRRIPAGGLERGVGGVSQSPGWTVRAGVIPRLRHSTLPSPITVTLQRGPRLFGVAAGGVYPLTAQIVEGTSYLVRWNPLRNSSPTTYKYEFQTPFETSSPTFSGVLEQGRGYWRMGNDLVNFAIRPPADTSVEVDLPLGTAAFQGWNLLANPFLASVQLADQQVRAGGSEAAANVAFGSEAASQLVSDSVWGYPLVDSNRPNAAGYQLYSLTFPGALAAIPVGAGVWARALKEAKWVWRLSSKQRGAGSAGSSRAAVPARTASGSGWIVRLTARAGQYYDNYNYFGVGNVTRQLHNPPPSAAAGQVDLRFESVGRGGVEEQYASAILPSGRSEPSTWRFVVDTNVTDESIALAWPDLSAVPRHVRLFLTDLDTGQQTYMRTASAYTYRNLSRAPRRFEIRAERNGAAALRITGIMATPGRGGSLDLSYVLSQPAEIRARITNAVGRTVGESPSSRPARSGVNRLTWAPRQNGRPLPPGFYVVEIIARTDEGRVARGISTLRLGR